MCAIGKLIVLRAQAIESMFLIENSIWKCQRNFRAHTAYANQTDKYKRIPLCVEFARTSCSPSMQSIWYAVYLK